MEADRMNRSIGAVRLPVNRLHLELTNICNFSCEFCPDAKMKRQRGMMPLELAQSILDEVSRTKVAKMVLFHVMGEPTLHPHLVDIAAYASGRGIETCLTTNGSRLDPELTDELVRAGVGRIIISLQTPDERTFSLRGARGVQFDEYADRVALIARRFLTGHGKTRLTISFLSSPLRRLIIPIFPEVSIADTSADLRRYLQAWTQRVLMHSPLEDRYNDVVKQMLRIWTFKENTIRVSDAVSFHTRVLGDWSVHFDRRNVNARVGYCPGLQENFGILWDGSYTFCCTDYEGATSTHTYRDTPIAQYLGSEAVQRVVKGFQKLRVVHPHCRQCLGDRNILNAVVKQIGSIAYFKLMRKENL